MLFTLFPFWKLTAIPDIWRTNHADRAAIKREYDPKTLQAHTHVALKNLLEHAYHTVPFYRNLWDMYGVSLQQIICGDDLWCLPVVSKEDFQQHPHIQWTSTIPGKAWPVLSSGTTTGTRRFALRDANAELANSLTIRRYLRAYGVSAGDTVVFLHAGERNPIYTELRRREWGTHRVHIHVMDFVESPEWMQAADVIAGPASQLEYVALHYAEKGFHSPKLFINYAERMSPAARRRISSLTNTPITDVYCASELSTLIGFTCQHNPGFHVNTDYLIIEVLNEQGKPCQPGETGEVVVTDLVNFVAPLIRYQLGDIVKLGESQYCSCGRVLPILVEQVVGRAGTEIVFNGQYFPVHPLVKQLESKGMMHFSLIQETPSTFVLKVYVNAGSNIQMKNQEFQKILQDYLGGEIKANIQAIPSRSLFQFPTKLQSFGIRVKKP